MLLMEIIVLDSRHAQAYKPENPTYAIRIIGSNPLWQESFGELQPSRLYKVVQKYVFDDIAFDFQEGVRLDAVLAQRMLQDFKDKRKDCSVLMVHCTLGKNRSPAVAIAFNEIFNLGKDSERLKKEFPMYTRPVYKVLVRTAENLNIAA